MAGSPIASRSSGRRPGNSRIGGIDPIAWLLVGSVFVFIGSSRQAWFELRGWYRQLDSTLELAMDIVEEDHQELIRRDLAGLSGPQLAVRKRKLHRLARSELEKRAAELLSPQEIELLAVSNRGAISWALIVTGSFCLALDPIIELFFR